MFGERAPVTDTTLRGAFFNLCLEHRREHLLRAIYEGVAYNLRWLVDAVRKAGFPCETVRAIGGGAKSDVWMQIIADVIQRRVEAVENPQYAGAVGCALAAAVALKIYDNYKALKNVIRIRKVFEPNEAHRSIYEEPYATFRYLYPSLSKACRMLNHPA
jgi:xylulokinase